MGNIKCIWEVHLIESLTRRFLERDNDSAILYPFKAVKIIVKELWTCPFCRRIVKSSECSCRDFKTRFARLQEFYGDNKHKSRLYMSNKNLVGGLFKPVADFQSRPLERDEISNLGADFWNSIDTQVDSLYSSCYKVSPVIHDGDKHFFICKEVNSESVYRFEVPKIEYKAMEIFLDDRSTSTYWKSFKMFRSWDDFSSYLRVGF